MQKDVSINRVGSGGNAQNSIPETARYVLESATHRIYAPELMIAIPGNDYNVSSETGSAGLSGNLINDLRQSKFWQSFLGNEVVTVGMQFNERWWLKASGFKSGQAQLDAGLSSYAHVFTNATRYGYDNNLTRPVFLDDRVKVQIYRQLRQVQGNQRLEDEVLRQLKYIYPDVEIPRPTRTVYHYFESGWSTLRHGGYLNGVTVDTLMQWAMQPSDVNEEDCSLVLPCDAWDVRKMGWASGGWDIASGWLNRCHGAQINDSYTACNPYTAPPLNQTWCDCLQGTTLPTAGQLYVDENCPNRNTEAVDELIVPATSLGQ